MVSSTDRGRRVLAPSPALQIGGGLVRIVEANIGVGQGHAPSLPAPRARPATGLLIPPLARTVPRTLFPEDNDIVLVRELLEHGHLKPDEKFESPHDAIHEGLHRLLLTPAVKKLDDNYDMVRVWVGEDRDICFTIWGGIEANGPSGLAKFARKFERSTTAVNWIGWLLNNHELIAGPHNFDYYVDNFYTPGRADPDSSDQWLEDEPESEEEEEDTNAEKVAQKGATRKVSNEAFMAKGRKEYAAFKKAHPWLYIVKGKEPPRAPALAAVKRIDKKLVPILEAMAETRKASPLYTSNEPWLPFCWEKGSIINHCWDYIFHMYQNGEFDSGNNNEACVTSGSVTTIRAKVEAFDRTLGPVLDFERYLGRL